REKAEAERLEPKTAASAERQPPRKEQRARVVFGAGAVLVVLILVLVVRFSTTQRPAPEGSAPETATTSTATSETAVSQAATPQVGSTPINSNTPKMSSADAAAEGDKYYNGQGVTQDYAKAFEWYRKAADQGNADAQDMLGVMYDNGQGV